MASEKKREPKARPFPWVCSDCATLTVVPTVGEYTAKVKQDGVIHELYFPAIEIPRCQTCGNAFITSEVDEQINAALREKLRLLTPAQMRDGIDRLGLKQQELAERLGVAAETISRWVNGALIQSRAMDNVLRVYFAVPEVRAVLRGVEQDPNLGTIVVGGVLMARPALAEVASLDFDTLMALAERMAVERADGHLTLMRFTTGWKCMIGTPNLDTGGRKEVLKLLKSDTAREALVAMICGRTCANVATHLQQGANEG